MISAFERSVAKAQAIAKARKKLKSHGLIQAGHAPIVRQDEPVGGGANDTIDGGGREDAAKKKNGGHVPERAGEDYNMEGLVPPVVPQVVEGAGEDSLGHSGKGKSKHQR